MPTPRTAHETDLELRPGAEPGRATVVLPPRRGRVGSFLRGLVVGVLALVGLLFVASRLVSIDLNPFDEQTTDRSQRPLLQSIRDLSRYTAAEGSFQQIVDLEDDRRYVPDFLLGDRTLFVASGSVQVYVDFSGLDGDAVVTDPADPGAVSITLPTPQLGEADLDLDDSYVASEQRGVINRVQDAFGDDSDDQAEVYRLARDKITAAAQETELVDRAEDNTRAMLDGLLGALGFTDVSVEFETPAG